jgi:phosphatidylserine/phosphatidylglycerophosphate/cardiolipin synthase-like enzyme
MPVAATQRFFPFADRKAFAGTPVKFRLDNHLPLGACHHQKMIVIDDRLAYCGGGDIGPDRWDTPLHLDDDPRREKTRRDHKDYDSRHEVMGVVDGAAAQMLSRVFRDRWTRACGEQLTLDETKSSTADLWPASVTPDFRNVLAGASRTQGRWKSYPSVREVEALHLRSIREAKRTIYMESQYFTSPLIAEALAARLRQAEGPEVLLVSTEHSPSYFDRATMDKTRWDFLSRLQEADRHDRFRAFSPVTTLGRTIIVHAKLSIIDDRLLRIGSANINNRSMGFDTECDLSFEGDEADAAFTQRLAELRTDLIAHWFGCRRQNVEGAVKEAGGRLIAGIEALRKDGRIRLRPIPTGKLSGLPAVIARNHLGDPVASEDAWRPWRRRSAASERLQTYHLNPEASGLTGED